MIERTGEAMAGAFVEGMESENNPDFYEEDLEEVLNRLFQSELGGWTEEVVEFTRMVLLALASFVPELNYGGLPENQRALALLGGSVARRWYEDSPHVFGACHVYQRMFNSEGSELEGLDEVSLRALKGLTDGPFDIDIKVYGGRESLPGALTKLRLVVSEFFSVFSKAEEQAGEDTRWSFYCIRPTHQCETQEALMWQKDIGGGRTAFHFRLTESVPPHRTFNIQITNAPEEGYINDYRRGKYFSNRQNLLVPLITDDREYDHTRILVGEINSGIQIVKDFSKFPDRILYPEYVSLPQALIAGLRMIRDSCLWPPRTQNRVTDFIDERTIREFRRSLDTNLESYLKSDEEADLFRVEEIMREAALCLTLNPVIFTRLAKALGIIELFIPMFEHYTYYELGEKTVTQALSKELGARRITNGFELSDGALYNFEKQYIERLNNGSLRAEEIGPLIFLKAFKKLRFFLGAPLNLASTVGIFDLRNLKRRYKGIVAKDLAYGFVNHFTFGNAQTLLDLIWQTAGAIRSPDFPGQGIMVRLSKRPK